MFKYVYKNKYLRSIGFRDDVVGDDVYHRTGSERQRIGQRGLRSCHCDCAQHAKYWLHHARQLAIPAGKQ